MRKKEVYIAGPMTGIQGFNFPAFDAARDKLEAQGFAALSPADMERDRRPDVDYTQLDGNTLPPHFDLEETALRDLEAVAECETIFLLRGWEKSKGARAEKAVAEWLGKTIWYEDGPDFSCESSVFRGGLGTGRSGIAPVVLDYGLPGAAVPSGWTSDPVQVFDNPYDLPDLRTLPEGTLPCERCGEPVIIGDTMHYCSKDWTWFNSEDMAQAGNPENKGVEGGKPSNTENPKDAIGSGKLPIHLWPTTATMMGCIGFLNGMLKYGRHNFRAVGVRSSIYYDACRRHIDAWFEGEDIDPDDNVPHLSAALCCLAIIVDAGAAGKLNDDRNFPGGYRKLRDELSPLVTQLKEKHADKDPKHYTKKDVDTDIPL